VAKLSKDELDKIKSFMEGKNNSEVDSFLKQIEMEINNG
jgi:hypothetical protein